MGNYTGGNTSINTDGSYWITTGSDSVQVSTFGSGTTAFQQPCAFCGEMQEERTCPECTEMWKELKGLFLAKRFKDLLELLDD